MKTVREQQFTLSDAHSVDVFLRPNVIEWKTLISNIDIRVGLKVKIILWSHGALNVLINNVC